MKVIDFSKHKGLKEEYLSELEAWDALTNLTEDEVLFITNDNGKLKVARIKAKRFLIDMEKL
jgi:hypothetical protein